MSVYVKVQRPSGKFENKRKGRRKFSKNDVDVEVEKALKKFKKKVKDSKILKIYNDRMYFVKPSEEKRAKRLISKYRARQQTLATRD